MRYLYRVKCGHSCLHLKMGRTKPEYGLDLQQQTETFEDCTKQVNTVLCRYSRMSFFVRDFVGLHLEAAPAHVDYTFPFASVAVGDAGADGLFVFDSWDSPKSRI